MTGTAATEPTARPTPRGHWWALPLALILIGGCAEEPLPQRRISHSDCLRDLSMDQLDQSLRRCDRVVARFPRDPQPLNDRFLIHTLRGDTVKACQDIAAAAKLVAARPSEPLDPLLRNDLRLRLASCRD